MSVRGLSSRQQKLLARITASDASGQPRSLPVVSQADAAALTSALHREVDDAVRARAEYAAQEGYRIACGKGCSACCVNIIMVSEGEAVTVARWLAEPAQAAIRQRFERAYPAWFELVGEAAAELGALEARGHIAEAEALFSELRGRRAMCAFNHEGACSIYPVRPTVCRYAHAVETSANCEPDAPEPPAALEFPPADELVTGARPFVRRLAVALGRPHSAALCESVHRLLSPVEPSAPPPSRNATCPCGSGAKYKRCCGQDVAG